MNRRGGWRCRVDSQAGVGCRAGEERDFLTRKVVSWQVSCLRDYAGYFPSHVLMGRVLEKRRIMFLESIGPAYPLFMAFEGSFRLLYICALLAQTIHQPCRNVFLDFALPIDSGLSSHDHPKRSTCFWHGTGIIQGLSATYRSHRGSSREISNDYALCDFLSSREWCWRCLAFVHHYLALSPHQKCSYMTLKVCSQDEESPNFSNAYPLLRDFCLCTLTPISIGPDVYKYYLLR